uniref:Proteinase inhibitor I4 serpin n=1 Tax=Cyanothece sp. (strain PCC 7425 / ATCC 29141) TaxID=395961 RepID=B8HS87_CYAP4
MNNAKTPGIVAIVTLGLTLSAILGSWLQERSWSQDLLAQAGSIMHSVVAQMPQNSNPNIKINPQILSAQTRFSLKLFQAISQQNQGKNVLISPTSIALALSMTYNGAVGETQQAMAKAMELQGITLADLNRANADLKAVLQNPDPKVQLAIANSLWARQDFTLKPNFIQLNRQFYGAEVTNLNFTDANAVNRINGWVSQNTRGKITQIVDRIQPDDVLFLINAIYFKGAWSQPFDPKATQNKPFYRAQGDNRPVPMMSLQEDLSYLSTEQFQAVSLPYGDKKRMRMDIFLPHKSSNLTSFTKTLTVQNWQNWLKQFSTREVALQFPRFKVEYGTELKPVLSSLGMGVAFTHQANFANLSPQPTLISQVKHKTFVEVNEEGTEAAAATSVGIMVTSARIPVEMVVDRPFFYAIRDEQTGAILFMGTMTNP